MITNYENMKQ